MDAFSIQAIPREKNARADLLVVSSSLLLPHPELKDKEYKVEVLFGPNIPNNVESSKFFDEVKKIQYFLEGVEPFTDLYFEGSDSPYQEFSPNNSKDLELGVEQLKGNKMPRHLISLERLFNRHDAYIRRERGKKGGILDDYEGLKCRH